MSVISVFIDLTRSTEIKQDIANMTKNNPEYARELMEDYAKKIAWAEMRFLNIIEASDIGVENIFLMKSLGDGMWFTIPFEGIDDARTKIASLLGHMMYSCQETDSTFMSSEPGIYDNKLHFETYDHTEHKHIIFMKKIFIDIINYYFDINTIRYNYHSKTISEILRNRKIKSGEYNQENNFTENDQRTIATFISNMNIGISIVEGSKIQTHVRTDFIGPDVDRFFRCTDFTHPSFTVIGQTLFNYVFEKAAADNVYYISKKHGDSHTSNKSFTCLQELHPACSMKGVIGDYSTYLVLKDPPLFCPADESHITEKIKKIFADNKLDKYLPEPCPEHV